MKRLNLKTTNVVRSDTLRSINRRIVLNYIRESGPISRSEIAKQTALQRSTVSLIVNELRKEGMIKEVHGQSSGGRPPILLSLQTMRPVALGIAVTTINTTVVSSDLTGKIISQEEFPTDPDVGVTMDRILECAKRVIAESGGTIEGIGVSVPGVVDTEKGEALFVPHFKWRDLKIGEILERETGLTVKVGNDANAAALAELWFGQSEVREVRDFIMVLVEEGVGTGIVFDGQIYDGKGGTAGEFGHMTIGQGAPVTCATGSRECWEAFASERAALARYKNFLNNGAARDINVEKLIDLALGGDEAATKAIKETAHYLGIGIANIIQGLGPEAVIITGALARAWALIGDELNSSVEECLCREYHSTLIMASTLGKESAIMGALTLILAPKFAPVV